LLFTLAPFFPLLLLLDTLPQALLTFRLQKGVWEAMLFGAPEARRMRYFAEVLLSPEAAKEVRLFGLLPFFRGRYLEAFYSLYQSLRRARGRQALGASLLVLLSALYTAVALFLGLRQALLGAGGLAAWCFCCIRWGACSKTSTAWCRTAACSTRAFCTLSGSRASWPAPLRWPLQTQAEWYGALRRFALKTWGSATQMAGARWRGSPL